MDKIFKTLIVILLLNSQSFFAQQAQTIETQEIELKRNEAERNDS